MKIPASTSFVMAATASLALQSSALAMPVPGSPNLGGVSPRSARTAPTAQFSGRAPAIRTGSGSRRSLPRRGIKLRDTDNADPESSGSLDGLMQEVSGKLQGLGLGIGKKDTDAPAVHSNATAFVARQAPVPMAPPGLPGATGSMYSMPAPQIPPGGVPQMAQGTVEHDAGTVAPASYEPVIAYQIGQTADGAVYHLLGEVAGVPGQVIGGTPVSGAYGGAGPGSIVGGTSGGISFVGGLAGGVIQGFQNPLGTVQGAAGGLHNGGAPFGALQAQTQPDGADDSAGNEDGTVSPSSTIATPSSSPAFTSLTDNFPPSPSASASAVPTPVMNIAAPAGLNNALVPVPSPLTGSLPIPSSAPTPSLPVSVPPPSDSAGSRTLQAAGQPEHMVPNLPVSPPVSIPGGAPAVPSPPVNAPSGVLVSPVSLPVTTPIPSATSPPVFIRARRTLDVRGMMQLPSAPTGIPPLPSSFPTPSAPIPNDTPPLLQPSGVGAKDAVSADEYPTSSISFDDQVSATSTAQPESSTLSMSSSMGATTTASSLSSRRRFFRFNREENA